MPDLFKFRALARNLAANQADRLRYFNLEAVGRPSVVDPDPYVFEPHGSGSVIICADQQANKYEKH